MHDGDMFLMNFIMSCISNIMKYAEAPCLFSADSSPCKLYAILIK